MEDDKGTPRPPASGEVVSLEDAKKRRVRRMKVLEPSVLFERVTSEFKEVEIGPEDGHWYGTVTLDE